MKGYVTLLEIEAAACAACRVGVDEIRGKGRMPDTVRARRVYVLLCRELTCRSFPEIASSMGRRYHSSAKTQYDAGRNHIDNDTPEGREILAACDSAKKILGLTEQEPTQ